MKSKYKYVVIVLAVISLGCAGFSYKRNMPTPMESALGYITTPIQSIGINIIEKLGSLADYFKDKTELGNEKEKLREELLIARAEINRLKLIEDENTQLESLLEIQDIYSDYPTTGARVIAKDPGNWFSTFLIDKGTDHGLKKNMAVMTADGLVGKISECGYNYSKVVSIIDNTDAVSAQSVRTNSIGYVTADLSEEAQCKMQYSDNASDILAGDEIVTSHISEIYPPGISIGHVKRLTSDDKTSMKYAIIEPSVDFSKLDYVLVITKEPGYEFIEAETESGDK